MKSCKFVKALAIAALLVGQSASAAVGDTAFTVSGPITLIDGTLMFGAYGDVLHQLTPEIEVGGETGVLYGSSSVSSILGSSYSVSTLMIPILAKGIYHFKIPSAPKLFPYAGASLGLSIMSSSVSGDSAVVVTGGSSTSFTFLVHGGLKLGEDKKLFADLRLGVVDSGFVFGPTVGYRF